MEHILTKLLVSCFSIIVSQSAFSQAHWHGALIGDQSSEADSLIIQHFSLEVNPFLLSEVKKYIKEQEDSCVLFKKGFGYVTISGLKLGRNGRPIPADSLSTHFMDIETEFSLGISSFYPHQGIGTPQYYAFVKERLVLIYDQHSE